MEDWDDLRYFLAVARLGSTLAASKALRASQSTVFRRIRVLESHLALRLFERRPSGYSLTEAGIALIPVAERIEGGVADFQQVAARETRRETTVVRFSAPDSALEYMLPTVMAGFNSRHPFARIEIVTSDRQLDLSTGEADVVVRSNPASDPALIGRRLSKEFGVLAASHAYASRNPLPRTEAELASHPFIDLHGLLGTLLRSWIDRVVPPNRILLRPDSMASTLSAVRSGLGLAILPSFIADRDPTLAIAPLLPPMKPAELWVLTHERCRRSTAVQTLMELVATYVVTTSRDRERIHPTVSRTGMPGSNHD